jgi:hypothetical protein
MSDAEELKARDHTIETLRAALAHVTAKRTTDITELAHLRAEVVDLLHDLNKVIGELDVAETELAAAKEALRADRMRLEQTRQWRNYYRQMWLGGSVSELAMPPTDIDLEAAIRIISTSKEL